MEENLIAVAQTHIHSLANTVQRTVQTKVQKVIGRQSKNAHAYYSPRIIFLIMRRPRSARLFRFPTTC